MRLITLLVLVLYCTGGCLTQSVGKAAVGEASVDNLSVTEVAATGAALGDTSVPVDTVTEAAVDDFLKAVVGDATVPKALPRALLLPPAPPPSLSPPPSVSEATVGEAAVIGTAVTGATEAAFFRDAVGQVAVVEAVLQKLPLPKLPPALPLTVSNATEYNQTLSTSAVVRSAVMGEDIVYIRTGPSTTDRTDRRVEIHVITRSSGYGWWGLQEGLYGGNKGFTLTDPWYTMSTFTYLIGSNKDLYVVKHKGESGGLELHRLSASSKYQSYTLNTAVRSPYSPDVSTMKFALGSGNDLYIFVVGGTTGTGRVELHVLSSASSYRWQSRNVGLGPSELSLNHPWYYNSAFQFLVGSNNDIYLVKYSGESGRVEVHIVSSASNYQNWALNTATALPSMSSDEMTFHLGPRDDLYCIKYRGGTATTEIHILTRASNFNSFSVQRGTCLTDPTVSSTTSQFPNGDPYGVVFSGWPIWNANDQGVYYQMPRGLATNGARTSSWLGVDGCSAMGGAQYMPELNPVCNAHDICYYCMATPGWGLDQLVCDNIMKKSCHKVCDDIYPGFIATWNRNLCGHTCDIMYDGLRLGNTFNIAGLADKVGYNCITGNHKYPRSYTEKPFKAGFPASACNDHPC
jgi:hypothetical protein